MDAHTEAFAKNQKSLTVSSRWCRSIIKSCYWSLIINAIVLIFVWYFITRKMFHVSPLIYWRDIILIPSAVMAMLIVNGDILIRAKRLSVRAGEYISILLMILICAFLCFVHYNVTILLSAFIVPIFVSTVFLDSRMTRHVYILCQIGLILCGLWMHISNMRALGVWIWVEMATVSGLLAAAYLMSQVLFRYGQFYASSLSHAYEEQDTLYQRLNRDALTGLYSRNAYEELFPKIVKDSTTFQIPLTMAMIDLDDFKKINDTYGHAAGDKALQKLAQIMMSTQNENIKAFRTGGEEFILLFEGYSVEEASKICEGMGAIVASAQISEINNKKMTISCGLAGLDERMKEPSDLFKAADSALYCAKKNGKNKTIVYFDNLESKCATGAE